MVSGTVFNEILLWCVTSSRRGDNSTGSSAADSSVEREKVRLTLTGHEVLLKHCLDDSTRGGVACLVMSQGVIFSVRLSGHRLVSVSDDRTVRVWDLPPHWESMERCA